jgi:hypothetical protein
MEPSGFTQKVMLAYAEENKDYAAVLRNFGLS